jgi:hypothetical protein
MFYLDLNSEEIDQLSIYEICLTCSAVCKHILTYLEEIVVIYKPIEQFYFGKCQRFIYKYIDIINRIPPDKSEISVKDDDMRIYDINCMVMNQQMSVSFVKVTPSLLSFQMAGSITLIKLINAIVQSALISLSKRKTFSSHCNLLGRCSLKMHEITKYMLGIFYLMPNCGIPLTHGRIRFLSIIAIFDKNIPKEENRKEIEIEYSVPLNTDQERFNDDLLPEFKRLGQ